MGNARWKGVPLKAVLDKAGVQRGAHQVTFNEIEPISNKSGLHQGARHRPRPRRRGHAGLCHERAESAGAQQLPAPARRAGILRDLLGEAPQRNHRRRRRVRRVLDEVGLWPLPDNACACVPAGTAPKATVPINRLDVRSFITNVTDGAKLKVGRETLLKGIAFDGGYGINEVAVSTDGDNLDRCCAQQGPRQMLRSANGGCR